MECYCRSKPENKRYQQQMHVILRGKGMFNITEQRLMDQQSQIRKKQWLTNLEIQRRNTEKEYREE